MTQEIQIADFVRLGYLQELNRRFLHPIGLALSVVVERDGSATLGGIWDYRDDPEGIRYNKDVIDTDDSREKARRIALDQKNREEVRRAVLGYWIQPVPGVEDAP